MITKQELEKMEPYEAIQELVNEFPEEMREAARWHYAFEFFRCLRPQLVKHKQPLEPWRDGWKRLYSDYIKSDTWKYRASVMKSRFDNRCQICNRNGDDTILHVHHRTYERLGLELPEDLTVLCDECHRHYHREIDV